jgi:hypothetical protein
MNIQGQLTEEFRSVRGDPVRIIQLFLAGLTLVGVAAAIVLAPGAAGSTHSLADTGVASVSLTSDSVTLAPDSVTLAPDSVTLAPDSVVWDLAS